MALDSRQKRAAIIGTARAWYRNPHPSSVNAAQRASIGQAYPVAAFSAPVGGDADGVNFIYNSPEPSNDDFGRQSVLPDGFGDTEWAMSLWVKPDSDYPFGVVNGGENSATNWSNQDPEPPATTVNGGWWYDGNFLLDGHNNTNTFNGTCSLQFYGSGRVRWLIADGTNLCGVQAYPATDAPNIVDSQWHQIYCVARYSGTVDTDYELWVDGVLEGSVTILNNRTNFATSYWDSWTGFNETDQDNWVWGAEKYSSLNEIDHWADFKGVVSNIAFWSDVPTQSDIEDEFAAGVGALVGDETNLVGLYRLDEGTGTTASDELASGGDITFYLGATETAPDWYTQPTSLLPLMMAYL